MILKLTIDRFEGEQAILKTEDNASINWPKSKLPADCQEGSSLLFAISNNPQKDLTSKQLAKDILNEILNTNNAPN